VKFEIETNGSFYGGWVAYILGLPCDSDDLGFREGWSMGHKVCDLSTASPNIVIQARFGRLYIALLAEIEASHISVQVKEL
jgi:hypothetical protein